MSLTDRERQVLALLADGHDQATIAGQLYLSQSAVRSTSRRIYRKLHANTAAQAVSIAYQRGLLAVDATTEADLAVVRTLRLPGYRLALVPIREDAP